MLRPGRAFIQTFRRIVMSRIATILASAALLSLVAGGAVLAQPASPPPATTPATPPTKAETAGTKKKAAEDRKMKKQMAADCRSKAKEQNLKGAKRKEFVTECMSKPM